MIRNQYSIISEADASTVVSTYEARKPSIQHLLQTLCPNGVEWKTLGEVCSIATGDQLNKEQLLTDDSLYPVMNGGIYPSGYWKEYNTSANTIIISQGGASAGYTQFMETPFWAGAHCFKVSLLHENLNKKYLYHFIKNNQEKLISTQQGAGIPSMSKKVFYEIEIPLPPLAIQERIVEILDKFSMLSAELELRKKQYDFYRNRLLSFDSNSDTVQWKTLGEVGTFTRGNGLQKKDFTEQGIGCIHYGQIYTKLGTFTDKTLTFVPQVLAKKLAKVEYGNLVIACTSENVEDVCKAVVWLGKEEIVIGGHAAVYRHKQNPKYVAYFFQSRSFYDQKVKFAKGVKVIDIKINELEKIKIPLPSLPVQERIVGILDKFETLVSDLSQGLPAEIALVQKQYEYYRDLLLKF